MSSYDLGRTSCVSKILLIICDEVQNQPYFETANGDISTIIPRLLESSQVCPSIAFVFRGNNFDRAKDINDYISCLPSKCTIIGCDDVPLFIPPVPDSSISQASVTLIHFPDAHVHSFSFDNGNISASVFTFYYVFNVLCMSIDECEVIMEAEHVGEEFAKKAGFQEEEREWKMFILLVASEDGIEKLVVQLQEVYPNVVIIGALCQRAYSRPCKRGFGSSTMFEGEGIAGIAVSGNVPFKSLIASPRWTQSHKVFPLPFYPLYPLSTHIFSLRVHTCH